MTTPPAGAVRTPARSPQGRGRLPRPTPCPTVYFPQCSTTAPPRFGERTTTYMISCACTPSLLVSIKGGGGLPLRGSRAIRSIRYYATLSTTEHPILALASINFSSSRDLGASLPLSPRLYPLLQAPLVQDNTVPSHTPLLDVRPRGRNQDKPVRYCVASCINIWDEKKSGIITSWVWTAGSGHRQMS